MDHKKALAAFQRQQWEAENKRGIRFQFTFEEWVNWWETHLGPDWQCKRGCKRGQYVMARYGDRGPYHPSNVRCIPTAINGAEYNILRKPQNKNQRSRLNKKQVTEIYKSAATRQQLAKKYGVADHQIKGIKVGMYYRSITSSL